MSWGLTEQSPFLGALNFANLADVDLTPQTQPPAKPTRFEQVAMSSDQTLVQLAQQISEASKLIQDYIKADSNTKLSFNPDGVERFPKAPDDIMKARVALLDATSALRHLVLGPDEVLKSHAQTPPNITVLSCILEFNVPKHVFSKARSRTKICPRRRAFKMLTAFVGYFGMLCCFEYSRSQSLDD
ncbi:hypothetical protein PRZ48_006740 [Zasmidium cellare]|uniref:Uncharacterized protein n=1 Tax=Zasmidium cellare TaxID=395010 RepID=A0ABR0ENX9_ZASCE|nr:hypothetical protein PRZ48_006740 [Zasmidium cellare]